ncbi:hypothetical protein DFQ13_103503 [Actinokineospora spheciospongiae]|nr:hypothetical protein DFQ13_103503 [Actinokineospora spheciospongiae]
MVRSLPLVRWGTSPYWLDRAHVVLDRRAMGGSFDMRGLCRIPVDTAAPSRPEGKLLCPDCAIALVAAAYPVAELSGRLPLTGST